MQVKKQQLELDMKKQTGFKLGKEYVKAVYGRRGAIRRKKINEDLNIINKRNKNLKM